MIQDAVKWTRETRDTTLLLLFVFVLMMQLPLSCCYHVWMRWREQYPWGQCVCVCACVCVWERQHCIACIFSSDMCTRWEKHCCHGNRSPSPLASDFLDPLPPTLSINLPPLSSLGYWNPTLLMCNDGVLQCEDLNYNQSLLLGQRF